MKAHQRVIREREAGRTDLLGAWWEDIDTSLSKAEVREISHTKASEIILKYEWLGDMPQAATRSFGLFHAGVLAGAVVFATKPGANLVSSSSGVVPPDALYLSRGACAHWAHPHAASWMISRVCALLAPCSVLAYSDPAAGEIGTIYQALGWVHIGASKGGQTAFLVDGKMITARSFKRDRNYEVGQSIEEVRRAFPRAHVVPVPRKSRYVGVYGPKHYKRNILSKLAQEAKPYPKRAEQMSEGQSALPTQKAGFDSPAPLQLTKPDIEGAAV